jgi:hypothetical protein
MRRVKLTDEGHTLEDNKRLSQEDALCDHCGDKDCSIGKIMARLKQNRFQARTEVISCKSFIPVLSFQSNAGMAGTFNTFRLGGAWAERVAPGSEVSLTRSGGMEICRARVIEVHKGSFPEMAAVHAVYNHLAIEAEFNGEEFDMEQVMRQVYGPNRFGPNGVVSVIYLRREDGD